MQHNQPRYTWWTDENLVESLLIMCVNWMKPLFTVSVAALVNRKSNTCLKQCAEPCNRSLGIKICHVPRNSGCSRRWSINTTSILGCQVHYRCQHAVKNPITNPLETKCGLWSVLKTSLSFGRGSIFRHGCRCTQSQNLRAKFLVSSWSTLTSSRRFLLRLIHD